MPLSPWTYTVPSLPAMVTEPPSASTMAPAHSSAVRVLSPVTTQVEVSSITTRQPPSPPSPAQDSSSITAPVSTLPSVRYRSRLEMLSQRTSPSMSCRMAVNTQFAPFVPVAPQPRWLALPVQRRKYSQSSAATMSTPRRVNTLSVLVV